MTTDATADVLRQLTQAGLQAGELLGIALDPSTGVGLAHGDERVAVEADDTDLAVVLTAIDEQLEPRWVWWDRTCADTLAASGVSIDRCWDVTVVDRLLHGGWRASIPGIWARLHDLDPDTAPKMGQLGLLDAHGDEGDDPDQPVRPDGHLRPEWVHETWRASPERLAIWAGLALDAAAIQQHLLAEPPLPARARSTAHAESAAEMLCAELAHHGLPVDEAEMLRIIGDAVGRRPRDPADEDVLRAERDAEVLRHLDFPKQVNLRNPAEVKAMLRSVGVDLPDTRARRLEQARDQHPLIDALLTWRKAERIATTYGYRWLDEHVRDGRLIGGWSSSDGAAGRMTASAGLHNLPAEMRSGVAAGTGRVFVRADLGQIEPRVLAAVSGDQALIAATADDDLYQPVARQLGVEREIAKLAVLGAMYGATTGESAHALRGLQQSYPIAMGLLETAAADGQARRDVMTHGGRRVRMGADPAAGPGFLDGEEATRIAAARGRYARNALIQGAAAEFFKVWAVIVRRRCRELDARVVLCLHDELLVHAPEGHGEAAAAIVRDSVAQAAHYWSPSPDVRFLADVSVISRWSEAKE